MCGNPGYTVAKIDPASELCVLVAARTTTHITTVEVRRLIREHWSEIKRLAHAIHDEESSEFRRSQRKALAELDDYSKYG